MKLRVFTHLVLPVLGVAGVAFGVLYALKAPEKSPASTDTAAQVTLPPTSSFEHSISGSGLVEANTRNIEIGSHLSGIVSELFVAEGDLVEKGTPLFKLDDRSARAEIATAESNLSVARAQLAEANVSLADQKDQYARVSALKEGVAVTADRVSRLRFAVQTANTRVNVANAAVDEAEARLKTAKVTLEQTTVMAPITGRILKLNIRQGEFVQAGAGGIAPLVIGNDTPLHVRVSLDENDLWRFSKEAKAVGALRSNRDVTFPLAFVRLEPFVVPKTSLTGSTAERVDTRVLEVVYRIDVQDAPVYIGQQVDVFIEETKPKTAAAPEQPSAPPAAASALDTVPVANPTEPAAADPLASEAAPAPQAELPPPPTVPEISASSTPPTVQ